MAKLTQFVTAGGGQLLQTNLSKDEIQLAIQNQQLIECYLDGDSTGFWINPVHIERIFDEDSD